MESNFDWLHMFPLKLPVGGLYTTVFTTVLDVLLMSAIHLEIPYHQWGSVKINIYE